MEETGSRSHKLTLIGRKTLAINGVVDVYAFDVSEIILETEQGMLLIKGEEMHVTRLSLEKGEVDVEGSIDSLSYSSVSNNTKPEPKSLFGKIFGS